MSVPKAIAAIADELQVSHLSEYFGIWSIHGHALQSSVDRCSGLDLRQHIQTAPKLVAAQPANRVSGHGGTSIAIVSIDGPMMKYASSLSGGTSTVAIRQQIRSIGNDPTIGGTMVKVFSPGGTVSGNEDLAADLRWLATKMPVHAFIEDLGASAAYWIASQAERLSVNATGLVGSIGTYAVIEDSSGTAESLKLKVHVVRAGEFKGMGTPGTPVTEDQLKELQKTVDALNEHFLSAVEIGRKMTSKQVAKLADGGIHVGQEALTLGLVDAVSSFDEAMAVLADAVSQKAPKKERQTMSQDTNAGPAAATLAELKAAFPSADAAFRESQLEAGATIAAAHQAFALNQRDKTIAEQAATIEARDIEIATLKASLATEQAARADAEAKLAKTPTIVPAKQGVPPLGTSSAANGTPTGDAKSEWDAFLKSIATENPKLIPASVVSLACKRDPDLYQRMLDAVNS